MASDRVAHPRVEPTQAPQGDRRGEVAADGPDEGDPLARIPRVQGAPQRLQHGATQQFQRVVDGHGLFVLHEHARLATAARTLPDDVALGERFADAPRIAQEAQHRIHANRRIADPFVEAAHQFGLVHDRQLGEGHGRQVAASQDIAVHRGALSGGAQERGQPRGAPRGQADRRWPPTSRRCRSRSRSHARHSTTQRVSCTECSSVHPARAILASPLQP